MDAAVPQGSGVPGLRCMFQVALDFLAEAPASEQASRAARMLKARLLIQLRRGAEAIKVLDDLEPSSNPQQEADRLLALALETIVEERWIPIAANAGNLPFFLCFHARALTSRASATKASSRSANSNRTETFAWGF